MLHRKGAIGNRSPFFVEKSYLIRSTTVLWYTNLTLSAEKGTWDEKKRDVFRDADVVF